MAIELASKRAATTTQRGANDTKEQAEFYINVGYMGVNEVTGEEVFIGLANGIALDTMKDKPYGSSDDYNWLVQAKNTLRDDAMALTPDLQPGEGDLVDGMVVQIFRRKAPAAPVAASNPLKGSGLRLARNAG